MSLSGQSVPGATDPARYGLIASALAGRVVEVVAGRPGDGVWTDGHTITVDPETSPTSIVEAVVVQASMIGAGSLSGEAMRAVLRKEKVRSRYLALEGVRAVAGLGYLLPRSLSHMASAEIGDLTGSPEHSLAQARSRQPIPEPGFALGVLRPREVLAVLRREESAARAGGVGAGAKCDADDAPGSADMVSHNDSPPTPELLFDGPAATTGGRLLRRLLRGSARSTGDGPLGGRTGTGRGTPGDGARTVTGAPDTAGPGAPSPGNRKFRYPEWDSRLGCYRPQWCTVHELDTPAVHGNTASPPGDLGLRRPLARLGSGADTRHRQRHGDIDLDAVVESRVQVLASADPGDALYLATVHDRRDLSALILLDISGSAAEPGVGRIPIHDHQRTAVAALASTMIRLGDRVAVYTYSSHGRHNVRMNACKTFDERGDLPMLARLRELTPSGYSRLGAAIRHGAAIIDSHAGTSRRLLIVVSDGLAFDHGYELGYGAQDVRRALAEVRAQGTGCLCLTVGATTGSGDLRAVFGTAAHAAVPRPDLLAPVITRLFRSALKSAEYQKGSSAR